MERITDIGYVGVGKNVIDDSSFNPMPHNTRHGLRTPIIVINNIDEVTPTPGYTNRDNDGYIIEEKIPGKGLLVRQIGSLDFYNELSGFIHVNQKAGHKLYDACSGVSTAEFDPVYLTTPYKEDPNSWPIVAGTYFIDHNLDVYITYGWQDKIGSREIYFDFA